MGCLQFRAIVNTVRTFYVIYCVMEWLSHGKCFSLTGLYPIIFHNQLNQFTLPPAVWRVLIAPYLHQPLISPDSNANHSNGHIVYLIEISISIFLITENKHIFHINRQLHFLVCELPAICSFFYWLMSSCYWFIELFYTFGCKSFYGYMCFKYLLFHSLHFHSLNYFFWWRDI